MATAPAAAACGTKLMPSTFVPGTAKNRVPGSTLRLSEAIFAIEREACS
jgi:hypothetical protein